MARGLRHHYDDCGGVMDPGPILSLIIDLYMQLRAAEARVAELEKRTVGEG